MKMLRITRSKKEIKQPNIMELKQSIRNNLFIMNWMWVILLISLAEILLVRTMEYKILWAIMSVFIFAFISSLHTSQKQDRIIIELKKLKGE